MNQDGVTSERYKRGTPALSQAVNNQDIYLNCGEGGLNEPHCAP